MPLSPQRAPQGSDRRPTIAGMQLSPPEAHGRWLLITLSEMGGAGSKKAVLRRIEERYGSQLTDSDYLPQPSNEEVKRESRTPWQWTRMVKAGPLNLMRGAECGGR
jgi:hypothetical protein